MKNLTRFTRFMNYALIPAWVAVAILEYVTGNNIAVVLCLLLAANSFERVATFKLLDTMKDAA